MRFFIPRLTMVLLCQAVAVFGHLQPGAAEDVADSPRVARSVIAEIGWTQSRFDSVREGYQSLKWSNVAGASEYQVLDADGSTYYQGNLNEAFISGLPDGEHAFHVYALSPDGALIGVSDTPAVMIVNHWPLSQAVALFSVGLIVVIAMMLAIVIGARRATPTLLETETGR
jgi:hypothetical protein